MAVKRNYNKTSLQINVPLETCGFEDFSDLCEMGHPNYKKYVNRVKKSLYYGTFPSTDRPSKALTELLVDKFSGLCNQDGLDRLNLYDASSISYDACVTPCSVIVALLYLDRLRTHNPDYLSKTSSSQVFVVAMMVASKFLYDDGEEDEVYNDEWATSAAMILTDLNEAEKEFLGAIDWNLYVDLGKFITGLSYIEAEVAQKEALSRGYFIYSDLVSLSRVLPPVWTSFISIIGSALVVCTIGYTITLTIITAGAFMGMCTETDLTSVSIENTTVTEDIQCSQSLIQAESDLSIPELTMDIEDEEACIEDSERCNKQTKRTSRFSAIHTLTAALLLASSSTNKMIDSLVDSTSYLLPTPLSLDYSSWNTFASTVLNSTYHSFQLFTSTNLQKECCQSVPLLQSSKLRRDATRNKYLARKRSRVIKASAGEEILLDASSKTISDMAMNIETYQPMTTGVTTLKIDYEDIRVPSTSFIQNYSADLFDWISYQRHNVSDSFMDDNCYSGSITDRGEHCSTLHETNDLAYFWKSLGLTQFSIDLRYIIDIGWFRGVSFIT